MKVKITQSIFIVDEGIVDTNRVIEVTEKVGKELIGAKYAVLHEDEKVLTQEDAKEVSKPKRGKTAKAETKGDE